MARSIPLPRRILTVALLTAALLPALPDARACMPSMDDQALLGDHELLAAPIADFQQELLALVPKADPTISFVSPPDSRYDQDPQAIETDAADAGDLFQATQNYALSAALSAWREALRAKQNAPLPPGLPEEFALYESGAAAYHAGDLPAARAQWQKLLALPADQRTHRTLWATYMIARSLVDTDPASSIPLFESVRTLARQKAPDPLGLAAASLGWEARAHWKLHHLQPAIALHLQQDATGDPSAPWSLRDCAAQLLKADDATLKQAAALPDVQTIVTAYILAHGGPYSESPKPALAARWLSVMQSLSVKNMPGADRLAWAAYGAGDYPAAERWLTVGGANGRGTPLGQWIQAKLFLRQGATDKAMTCLAAAAKAFPQNEEWKDVPEEDGNVNVFPARRTAGNLAALTLARRHYTDALELLFRNGFITDGHYLAERVLTIDELKTFVDKLPRIKPDASELPHGDPPLEPDPTVPTYAALTDLRELLARRLVRLGRWKEARPYFTPEHQKLLDEYIAAIRDGQDAARSPAQRAASLWTAALLARNDGFELMGVAVDGGPSEHDDDPQPIVRPASTLAPVSADEKQRLAASAPVPDKRWHYRFLAADHAWDACLLMPNNTDLLARRLVQAGGWIKALDPRAADRFYKALVNRCPGTALGQAAEKLHWFPPLPPEPAAPTPTP